MSLYCFTLVFALGLNDVRICLRRLAQTTTTKALPPVCVRSSSPTAAGQRRICRPAAAPPGNLRSVLCLPTSAAPRPAPPRRQFRRLRSRRLALTPTTKPLEHSNGCRPRRLGPPPPTSDPARPAVATTLTTPGRRQSAAVPQSSLHWHNQSW
jgi:hypothetical protein